MMSDNNTCTFRYTGMGIDPASPRDDWWRLVKADGYTLGKRFFYIDNRGVTYTADKKLLLKAPNGLTGDYTVLPETLVICNRAFDFGRGIRLTNITLPEGLKAVGEFSLTGCMSDFVPLPSTVEYIGDRAISGRNLKRFIFPKSLKYITRRGIPLFVEEFISETPYVQLREGMIIINNSVVEYYGKDAHIVIPNDITRIGFNAFSCCKALVSVVIPEAVEVIEQGAFGYSTSLTDIQLLGHPKIGRDAFHKCPGYKKKD